MQTEVTRLLVRLRAGDRSALDALLPLVYAELRKVAAGYLRNERAGHTLQPTALVHEAYLHLAGLHSIDWQNRAHFVGVAARLMRRVLVDHARARRAAKREGVLERVTLDEALAAGEADVDLIALDEALDRLESFDPRLCRVVELRYFGGLTNQEISEALGISTATVDRDRVAATAWLRKELSQSET
jgi:RNA polymerase sigma factor (TIGR02999 family)